MKTTEPHIFARFLSAFLIGVLALPNPAYALRPGLSPHVKAGIEEALDGEAEKMELPVPKQIHEIANWFIGIKMTADPVSRKLSKAGKQELAESIGKIAALSGQMVAEIRGLMTAVAAEKQETDLKPQRERLRELIAEMHDLSQVLTRENLNAAVALTPSASDLPGLMEESLGLLEDMLNRLDPDPFAPGPFRVASRAVSADFPISQIVRRHGLALGQDGIIEFEMVQDVPPGMDLRLNGEQQYALATALTEVLRNAEKYRRLGAMLKVLVTAAYQPATGMLEVTVSDNGIGIPELKKDRYGSGEMFSNGNGVSERAGLGTQGIKERLRNLNPSGGIEVVRDKTWTEEEAPEGMGSGTTVRFWLPAELVSEESAAGAEEVKEEKVVIPSSDLAGDIGKKVEQMLAGLGDEMPGRSRMEQALNEILTNINEWGYLGFPKGYETVVSYGHGSDPERIVFTIRDRTLASRRERQLPAIEYRILEEPAELPERPADIEQAQDVHLKVTKLITGEAREGGFGSGIVLAWHKQGKLMVEESFDEDGKQIRLTFPLPQPPKFSGTPAAGAEEKMLVQLIFNIIQAEYPEIVNVFTPEELGKAAKASSWEELKPLVQKKLGTRKKDRKQIKPVSMNLFDAIRKARGILRRVEEDRRNKRLLQKDGREPGARWIEDRLIPALRKFSDSDMKDSAVLVEAGRQLPGIQPEKWQEMVSGMQRWIAEGGKSKLQVMAEFVRRINQDWLAAPGNWMLVPTPEDDIAGMDHAGSFLNQITAGKLAQPPLTLMLEGVEFRAYLVDSFGGGIGVCVPEAGSIFLNRNRVEEWVNNTWEDGWVIPGVPGEVEQIAQETVSLLSREIRQRYRTKEELRHALWTAVLIEEARHALDRIRVFKGRSQHTATWEEKSRFVEGILSEDPGGISRKIWTDPSRDPVMGEGNPAELKEKFYKWISELSAQSSRAAFDPKLALLLWVVSVGRRNSPGTDPTYPITAFHAIRLLARQMKLSEGTPYSEEAWSTATLGMEGLYKTARSLAQQPNEQLRLAFQSLHNREFRFPIDGPHLGRITPQGGYILDAGLDFSAPEKNRIAGLNPEVESLVASLAVDPSKSGMILRLQAHTGFGDANEALQFIDWIIGQGVDPGRITVVTEMAGINLRRLGEVVQALPAQDGGLENRRLALNLLGSDFLQNGELIGRIYDHYARTATSPAPLGLMIPEAGMRTLLQNVHSVGIKALDDTLRYQRSPDSPRERVFGVGLAQGLASRDLGRGIHQFQEKASLQSWILNWFSAQLSAFVVDALLAQRDQDEAEDWLRILMDFTIWGSLQRDAEFSGQLRQLIENSRGQGRLFVVVRGSAHAQLDSLMGDYGGLGHAVSEVHGVGEEPYQSLVLKRMTGNRAGQPLSGEEKEFASRFAFWQLGSSLLDARKIQHHLQSTLALRDLVRAVPEAEMQKYMEYLSGVARMFQFQGRPLSSPQAQASLACFLVALLNEEGETPDSLLQAVPELKSLGRGNVGQFIVQSGLEEEKPAAAGTEESIQEFALRRLSALRDGKWAPLLNYLGKDPAVLAAVMVERPSAVVTTKQWKAWLDAPELQDIYKPGDRQPFIGNVEAAIRWAKTEDARPVSPAPVVLPQRLVKTVPQWLNQDILPGMKRLAHSSLNDFSGLRAAAVHAPDGREAWERKVDQLKEWVERRKADQASEYQITAELVQQLNQEWFVPRNHVLVSGRGEYSGDRASDVVAMLAVGELIQEPGFFELEGESIPVYFVRAPDAPYAAAMWSSHLRMFMIQPEVMEKTLIGPRRPSQDLRALDFSAQPLADQARRLLAEALQRRYGDADSFVRAQAEFALQEEVRHGLDYRRNEVRMDRRYLGATLDFILQFVETHVRRPAAGEQPSVLRQIWESPYADILAGQNMEETRFALAMIIIELSGQLTRAVADPKMALETWRAFSVNAAWKPQSGWVGHANVGICAVRMLADQLGLTEGPSFSAGSWSPGRISQADFYTMIVRIASQPDERIRLAIQEIFAREFNHPVDEPPFLKITPEGGLISQHPSFALGPVAAAEETQEEKLLAVLNDTLYDVVPHIAIPLEGKHLAQLRALSPPDPESVAEVLANVPALSTVQPEELKRVADTVALFHRALDPLHPSFTIPAWVDATFNPPSASEEAEGAAEAGAVEQQPTQKGHMEWIRYRLQSIEPKFKPTSSILDQDVPLPLAMETQTIWDVMEQILKPRGWYLLFRRDSSRAAAVPMFLIQVRTTRAGRQVPVYGIEADEEMGAPQASANASEMSIYRNITNGFLRELYPFARKLFKEGGPYFRWDQGQIVFFLPKSDLQSQLQFMDHTIAMISIGRWEEDRAFSIFLEDILEEESAHSDRVDQWEKLLGREFSSKNVTAEEADLLMQATLAAGGTLRQRWEKVRTQPVEEQRKELLIVQEIEASLASLQHSPEPMVRYRNMLNRVRVMGSSIIHAESDSVILPVFDAGLYPSSSIPIIQSLMRDVTSNPPAFNKRLSDRSAAVRAQEFTLLAGGAETSAGAEELIAPLAEQRSVVVLAHSPGILELQAFLRVSDAEGPALSVREVQDSQQSALLLRNEPVGLLILTPAEAAAGADWRGGTGVPVVVMSPDLAAGLSKRELGALAAAAAKMPGGILYINGITRTEMEEAGAVLVLQMA